MSAPTFEQLAALEPRLADLLAEARRYHDHTPRRFCRIAVWDGYHGHRPGLKSRMAELVGWSCGRDGVLGTQEAFDVARRTIYGSLPGCRHRPGCCRSFASESRIRQDVAKDCEGRPADEYGCVIVWGDEL